MEDDIEQRLEKINEKLNKAKDLKIRAEEKDKQLKEEYKNIIREIKELKIDPSKIDEEIKNIEKEIIDKLEKVESGIENIELDNVSNVNSNVEIKKKVKSKDDDLIGKLDSLLDD
jgi:chromosome segregation ATPase